jgi:hypothetical protein
MIKKWEYFFIQYPHSQIGFPKTHPSIHPSILAWTLLAKNINIVERKRKHALNELEIGWLQYIS